MLHQKSVKYNRYYAQKEQRIQQSIATLSIDMIGDATFARVPSTSNSFTTYIVDIDESGKVPVATDCDCVGRKEFGKECVHFIAVNRFFARIYARPEINLCLFVKGFSPESDLVTACSVSEAEAEADTQVRINEQQEMVANDKTYTEAIGYAGDPRKEVVNPVTGMTDAEWQNYRYYEMGIGA